MMDNGRYGRDLTEETFHEFLERKDRGEEVDGEVRISGVAFVKCERGSQAILPTTAITMRVSRT